MFFLSPPGSRLEYDLQIHIILQSNNIYVKETWVQILEDDIIRVIFSNKPSMDDFNKIREAFYKILSHNIPGKLIMKKILKNILDSKLNDNQKIDIIEITSNAEFYLSNSSKDLIHLEYFVSQIINYLL